MNSIRNLLDSVTDSLNVSNLTDTDLREVIKKIDDLSRLANRKLLNHLKYKDIGDFDCFTDNKVQNVIIPNKLFMFMDKLNITGVRIFLYYLLITNRVKLSDKYFSYVLKEDLANAAGVSGRTLDRYLKVLTKYQLLNYTKLPTSLITSLKAEGKKVNGNTKALTLHNSIQLNTNYTKITKDMLQYLLVDLSDIGGVLYVYTYSQLNRLGSDFNLSQVTIGNKLNISQGAVSIGYKELLTKGYLKKESSGKGTSAITYWVDNSDKILKDIKIDKKNVQNTEVEISSIDTLVLDI